MDGNFDDDDFRDENEPLPRCLTYVNLSKTISKDDLLSRNVDNNCKMQKQYQNWMLLQNISVFRCLEYICCENMNTMDASAHVAQVIYDN